MHRISLMGGVRVKQYKCSDCLATNGIFRAGKTNCIWNLNKPCCALEVLWYIVRECKDRDAFLEECERVLEKSENDEQ